MTESSANYCWQKQETLKGSCLPAGTAYGGWGFAMFASNRFYVYDPADEAIHVHVTCRRPCVSTTVLSDRLLVPQPFPRNVI